MDWTELRNGDVFTLDKRSTGWNSMGWVYPSGSYFEVTKGYITKLGDADAIIGPVAVSSGDWRARYHQDVIKVDRASIPLTTLVTNLSSRANTSTGTDPEIFAVRGKERKSLLPAFRFLSTQEAAKKTSAVAARQPDIYSGGNNAYAYRDGFAAECYVQAGGCHGYLINYIRDGLNKVLEAAKAYDRTADLTIQNTFTIPKVTMDGAEDGEVALGCTPSMNAYDDSPKLPENARDFRLRFAGGHVHFGLNDKDPEKVKEMVKSCDIMAGIPAVAMFASLDTPVRRQFYGRAGEYRTPKHGLEYRVLSNAWLCSPEISHLTLNLVRIGLKVGKAGLRKCFNMEEEAARDIINSCDVKAARAFVSENLEIFGKLLANDGSTMGDAKSLKAFRDIIEGGVEAVKPDFESVSKNWLLATDAWHGESNGMKATWGYLCKQL